MMCIWRNSFHRIYIDELILVVMFPISLICCLLVPLIISTICDRIRAQQKLIRLHSRKTNSVSGRLSPKKPFFGWRNGCLFAWLSQFHPRLNGYQRPDSNIHQYIEIWPPRPRDGPFTVMIDD